MRIGRRPPSRLHALRFVLRCLLLAVLTFRAFFPSHAWVGGHGARRSPLVCSSPTSVVAVSTRLPLATLTSQSSGTPVKRRFSELAASRGAPYFNVSPPGTHVTLCSIFQPSKSALLRNARAYWLSGRHVRRLPFHAGCRLARVFGWPLRARRCPTVGGHSDSFGIGACSTAFVINHRTSCSSIVPASTSCYGRSHSTFRASKMHRENSAFFKPVR